MTEIRKIDHMTVYLITIILVLILAYMATFYHRQKNIDDKIVRENNRFFVFLIAGVLIFVSGFRWNVGTDYWQYSRNYNGYVNEVWKSISTFEEPGLRILAWLSSNIYDDYAVMFFLASLITVYLFVSTISKYSKMFVFSILLFIFAGIWHGTFNGVRQYLACAIIFSGHRYIINRYFWKYLLVVLLASLFHISAIGLLVIYFIPKVKLKFRHLIIMAASTLIILYSYGFVFELIESLKESELVITDYIKREVSVFRVLVAFAPLFLYFTITNKKILKPEDFFYVNILFINAFIFLATSQSAYLARFALYTNVFVVLGLPVLLNVKDKNLKFVLQLVILFFYGIFWYIDVSKTSSLVNYHWIFERNN